MKQNLGKVDRILRFALAFWWLGPFAPQYNVDNNYFLALTFTLLIALLIILIFTFYMSKAKKVSFRKRFAEMAMLSFGVAAFSFIVGLAIRKFLHIEI